ncbi:CD209 [Branchiostoma lanceolatum]|uniref:CD209 protein n=1 Tax=Branchiostoma lanceolatum TaxID=7740 RepID=A0A8J9Z760_BRALA|nr:CD209 [Branchiostoma lanceolatum]
MDKNIYKEACSIYDSTGDYQEACTVSKQRVSAEKMAPRARYGGYITAGNVEMSEEILGQPGSSRPQSNEKPIVANPESSETVGYIPGVGMRTPGRPQGLTRAIMMKNLPKLTIVLNVCLLGIAIFLRVGMRTPGQPQGLTRAIMMKNLPKLTIVLNVCLLGIAIFLMLSMWNLKLSVNQLDQKTGMTAANQANASGRLQQAMGKAAELSDRAKEYEKALRDIEAMVARTTHSDLLGVLENETKILEILGKLECHLKNPDGQSEKASVPTHLPGACPKGYKKYREVCYKLFNERKSFSESAETCRADGGTLAMPRDVAIDVFLRFGLHDEREEGEWEWMDGTALGRGYNFWAVGQPNHAGSGDDCAAYSADMWYDLDCRMKESFICQIVPSFYRHLPTYQI